MLIYNCWWSRGAKPTDKKLPVPRNGETGGLKGCQSSVGITPLLLLHRPLPLAVGCCIHWGCNFGTQTRKAAQLFYTSSFLKRNLRFCRSISQLRSNLVVPKVQLSLREQAYRFLFAIPNLQVGVCLPVPDASILALANKLFGREVLQPIQLVVRIQALHLSWKRLLLARRIDGAIHWVTHHMILGKGPWKARYLPSLLFLDLHHRYKT